MSTIHTLRPNVSREDAITHFSSLLATLQHGKVHTVADIYIPFRLFRVRITNRAKTEVAFLAQDAVEGTFDLYSFDSPPDAGSLVTINTRNIPPYRIDENQARTVVMERARRQVFSRGFFKIRELDIAAESIPLDFHVPYWVGFSGANNHLHLTVMDAVRRRSEGAKVRRFVNDWLSATPRSEQT